MHDPVHLSFYRFYDAGTPSDLQELGARVRNFGSSLGIKGTLLLAPEGVNAMVSGPRKVIESFKAFARETFGIADRDFKEGPVNEDAFHRFFVKVKREIISVGDTDLKPHAKTAPRVSPRELKQWLDEGREMILLDTRNRYEIEVGTFKNAEDFGLDTSREFAEKAAREIAIKPKKWSDRPIVAFCTGGIRCEKASAVLEKLGLRDVYQLDGGILKYFEENGNAHFDGGCFVFDWRLAVDGKLNPTARSKDASKSFGRHRQSDD